MRRIICIFLATLTLHAFGKQKDEMISFIVLGDIHYDLLEDHDMEWLRTKPDDFRQVTKEYTQFTKENWLPFSRVVREKVNKHKPPVKGILQLGDLSEGLAGSPQKAEQMANSVFSAIRKADWKVPIIITKGNHDITGPGAKEAFDNVYLPHMAKLAGHASLSSANYSTLVNEVLFVCYDPWDKGIDGLQKLEEQLSASTAKYKFVMLHEPVIPVNERCWHVHRHDAQKRDKLLQIIASHKAIVLCAHLHLYSIVRRDTQWGPIMQIMVNSVIKGKKKQVSNVEMAQYDASLVTAHPQWQTETMKQRIQWIEEESPHIRYFKKADVPGYGILSIDKTKDIIVLAYYTGFDLIPSDVINITEILNY